MPEKDGLESLTINHESSQKFELKKPSTWPEGTKFQIKSSEGEVLAGGTVCKKENSNAYEAGCFQIVSLKDKAHDFNVSKGLFRYIANPSNTILNPGYGLNDEVTSLQSSVIFMYFDMQTGKMIDSGRFEGLNPNELLIEGLYIEAIVDKTFSITTF
jgi:hypothetical protein